MISFLVLLLLKRHGLLRKTDVLPSRWNSTALAYLVRVAWPSALNQLLWYKAFLVLFATAATLPHGSMQALAGMSAGMRVESMLYLPVFALGLTSSVVMGNSLNKLSLQQARNLGYKIMSLGLGIISLPTILVWFAAEPLAGFMASDPETAREAATFLRFSICAMPFLVVYMILGEAMAGGGATIYQLLVMSGTAWLSCALADALATALVAMESSQALQMINSIDNVEALIIQLTPEGEYILHKSRGF